MILQFFPKLTSLAVSDCKVTRVSKEDFDGFECLKELYFGHNEVEYLPGNLFRNTRNLEYITFANNRIKYIDQDILDPLVNLKFFDLTGNSNVDVLYDRIHFGNVTLHGLKNLIALKCTRGVDPWKVIKIQRMQINDLTTRLDELNQKVIEMDTQLSQVKEATSEKALEATKNFIVKIGTNEYQVHREILVSFSPVIARAIQANPHAQSIDLQDISPDSFNHILNFMYTGNAPSHDANYIEIFAASCLLELNALCAISTSILKDKITPKNSYDILVLCNKYQKKNLMTKAFEEFSKNFPEKTLSFDLATQAENLKKLVKAKLDIDQVISGIN